MLRHREIPIRVLAMSRYGRLGASSRLRCHQYIPCLKEFSITQASLLDDAYVRGLYNRQVPYGRVLLAYLKRIRVLLRGSQFDIIWAEKELLPWLPAAIELGLLPRHIPLIVDYDDAVFHNYDEHRNPLVRRLLGTKIDAVMRRASIVTAGNDYLASRARSAGCKRVEYLPTVVDLDRYPGPGKSSRSSPFVLGWIGSPATAKYLTWLTPTLRSLQARYDFACVAIGARPDQVADTPFEAVEWAEDAEVALLQSLSVGLMPLPDAPWERGKCGYKLIQYMVSGLPVIASPVGVNSEIVDHGTSGFLARSAAEWEAAIERLILDADLRARMGAAGRSKVEATYSLQVQAPRLSSMLRSLVVSSDQAVAR